MKNTTAKLDKLACKGKLITGKTILMVRTTRKVPNLPEQSSGVFQCRKRDRFGCITTRHLTISSQNTGTLTFNEEDIEICRVTMRDVGRLKQEIATLGILFEDARMLKSSKERNAEIVHVYHLEFIFSRARTLVKPRF